MVYLPRLDGSGPRPPSGSTPTPASPPTPVTPVGGAGATGDARQEAFHRLNQIALQQLPLGKTLQAEVLSRVDAQTFLLKLSDASGEVEGRQQAAVRAALPEGLPDSLRTGAQLQLRLVATQPRPTFLLVDGADGGSAPTSLSHAARLIDLALQKEDGQAAAIAGKAPLLAAGSTPATRQLAAALQQALAGSGLFYESHLRQWVNGRRTLAQLQQEPQAAFSSALSGSTAGGATQAAGLPQQVDIVSTWAGNSTAASALLGEQDSRLLQLVGQQLHALENQRLAWQGEAWPGQGLEWEVQEQAREREGGAEQAEQAPARWTSTLRLDLPALGAIAATLQWEARRVKLQLDTADAHTRQLLQAQGGALAEALDVAGIPLDALKVQHAPPT